LMLSAGEAVALFAKELGVPVPYSTQEKRPISRDLPEDPIAKSFALRKTLSRTTYKSAPLPHAGLGLSAYVQATSPLRRYLDLAVHQQLRAALLGKRALGPEEILLRVGEAEAVANAVRGAEGASRTHFKLVWLMERPGYEGEGVVVETEPSRMRVFLPELALTAKLARSGGEAPGDRVRLRLAQVDLPYLRAVFARI